MVEWYHVLVPPGHPAPGEGSRERQGSECLAFGVEPLSEQSAIRGSRPVAGRPHDHESTVTGDAQVAKVELHSISVPLNSERRGHRYPRSVESSSLELGRPLGPIVGLVQGGGHVASPRIHTETARRRAWTRGSLMVATQAPPPALAIGRKARTKDKGPGK